MNTVLLPSASTPFVSIRILVRAGSVDDPPAREGLAALTGGLLAEGGTRRLTYSQMLQALYPMAAGIGVQVDRELTVVHGTVHRDHLDRYYELIRDVVLEPRFDAADFARVKTDQTNAIVSGLRATDDEGLGQAALAWMIHDAGPYGRPAEGTVQGIAAIEPEDVAAFHAARFNRGAVTLGLAGGYPAAFVDRVTEDLARLPDGAAPPRAPAPRRTRRAPEALVVTKPCRAWAISLGHPLSVTRADDDFYPLFVANSYFGEHRTFNGVLMTKMRSERGLNYGDYSYVEAFVQDGTSTFPIPNVARHRQAFTIWIRPVAAAHAHFALRLALRELRRLVRDGLTPGAFEETRAFLLNYRLLWAQTPSRRLGYAMDGAYYGRRSLGDELAERLPRLTVDEVNAAIRRHLDPDALRIAVVADPEGAPGFVERLVAGAPSRVVYETETQPGVVAEDEQIAVEPATLTAESCRIVAASDLFER